MSNRYVRADIGVGNGEGCLTLVLVLLHISEKDFNDEVLWVWSYPCVDGTTRNLLMKKCNLDQEEGKEGGKILAFNFGHFLQKWYYLSNFKVEENDKLSKVSL